jgi:hypothetical protein
VIADLRQQVADCNELIASQQAKIATIKKEQDEREIKLLQKFCLVLNAKKEKIRALMHDADQASQESDSANSEKVLDAIRSKRHHS